MYALILTILASGAAGGHFVTSIPGFSSAETCRMAGLDWTLSLGYPAAKVSALCVKVS